METSISSKLIKLEIFSRFLEFYVKMLSVSPAVHFHSIISSALAKYFYVHKDLKVVVNMNDIYRNLKSNIKNKEPTKNLSSVHFLCTSNIYLEQYLPNITQIAIKTSSSPKFLELSPIPWIPTIFSYSEICLTSITSRQAKKIHFTNLHKLISKGKYYPYNLRPGDIRTVSIEIRSR